jgi:hypothetical protein
MHNEENLASLRDRGADEFFIREILESMDDKLNNKTNWERCQYLTHGHVCGNPYSISSFGLYCPNSDRYRAGEDPLCDARNLKLDDIRPNSYGR